MAKQKPEGVPHTLENFDRLPDSANVRQPTVLALYGISGPTLWRWVKQGKAPKPRKLSSRVTVWNVGALRAALSGE
jgi:predicted DNA-binding transcriptional regulator AlpA